MLSGVNYSLSSYLGVPLRRSAGSRTSRIAKRASERTASCCSYRNSSQQAGNSVMGLNFDLLEQLTFYGSYHSNKWNQLIHFVFVPSIVWSLCVWLCYSGPLLPIPFDLSALPQWLSRYMVAKSKAVLPSSVMAPSDVDPSHPCSVLVFNGAAVVYAAYSLYYLKLEPFAGLTWSLFVGLPIWLTSTAFQQQARSTDFLG